LIATDDDRKGCQDTAVLSYGFWQREFGGQDSAIGSRITLGETPFVVMGVTPPEFFGVEVGRTFDVALPFCAREHLPKERLEFALGARDWFFLGVLGRLKNGESAETAAQKLQARSATWFQAVAPTGYATSAMEVWNRFRLTAEARPRGVSSLRNNYETSLWLLLGITGLVLLIACVNLANLLLARSSGRVREYTVRMALGASRARVVVQLFWESFLIALGGAIAGTGLAVILSEGVVRFVSTQEDAIVLDLGFDWRVVAFITALAIATCLTFGLSTALYATRGRAMGGANAGTRNATSDRVRFSFQRLLMVGQIAISLVLVAASLLFVRSFRNLLSTDVGFEMGGLSYYFADFSRLHLPAKDTKAYAATLLEELRAIPGVDSAALTTHLPLSGSSWSLGVRIPEHAEVQDSARFSQFTWTSPKYFSTLGIPFVSGRDFTEQDSAAASPVLVVNEQFGRQYFPNENPLGKTVVSLQEPNYPETLYQIVGVVKNTKYSNLREQLRPIAYAPDLQNPDRRPFSTVVIRSRTPFDATVKSVRAVAERLSPQLRINGSVNLRAQVTESLARDRLLAWLSGFFGVLAVVLATIGLYGVVSYMVSARRNEIGIRIALGASSRNVLTMILGQTAGLLVIGLAVGIGGAIALSNSVARLLFGLQPHDPLSFGGAALVLIVIGFGASWLPAWKSAKLDPNVALRQD
jgi:predicted permease